MKKRLYNLYMKDMFANERIIQYVSDSEEKAKSRWRENYGDGKSNWKLDKIIQIKEIDGHKIKLEEI